MLAIHTLRALKDNFIYMLVDTAGARTAAVDPGESGPVLEFLEAHEGLKLTHILCTHHHWDHVNGVEELARTFGCAVVGSVHDQGRIPCQSLAVDEKNPLFMWGSKVNILDLPGHTLGQIAYWLQEERAVFVGDTLFSAGCGRLFEGTPDQMFHSLQKLKTLPLDTHIYFGHEYTVRNLDFVLANDPNARAAREAREQALLALNAGQVTTPSTLELELRINPFLRARDVHEFTFWRELRNGY